jgi:hypothetical protein
MNICFKEKKDDPIHLVRVPRHGNSHLIVALNLVGGRLPSRPMLPIASGRSPPMPLHHPSSPRRRLCRARRRPRSNVDARGRRRREAAMRARAVQRGGGSIEGEGDAVPTATADADEAECASGGGSGGFGGTPITNLPFNN